MQRSFLLTSLTIPIHQHTDLKSDNAMVSFPEDGLPQVHIIDFGRAKALPSLRSQFDGLTSRDMKCRRMKENGSWGVEQDLYGFCRTIYLLLVGTEMEGPDHFKEAEKGAKYDAKCLPFLGKRQTAYLKLKDTLWIDLFLTLLNFDSREDSYEATVNELLGKMEGLVDENEARSEINEVKRMLA